MTIAVPLYTFLFLYLLFLTVFFAFIAANIYHVVLSASFTFASFLVTFFIFAGSVIVLFWTWDLIASVQIDWQEQVTIFDMNWFGGLLGM